MSPQKKRVLKGLALLYVALVVVFLVYTATVSRGDGIRRTLTEKLKGPAVTLTEPVELTSLEGQAATADVVDALLTAHVTVIGTTDDPKAPVGPALVQRAATFKAAVLPPGTTLTEALWEKVLRDELTHRTEAGEVPEVYVKGGGDIMGFDFTLLFVVVNFLGLLIILYLLLWEPILKVLDDRAATIETDLTTASKNREEAGSLKGKYQHLILGSKQERQELIAEGRKEGQAERQRIVGEARSEADKVIERTRGELEAAADEARRDLRKEIGGLSVELARKILAREVSEDDNRRLVEDFLAKLGDVESKG